MKADKRSRGDPQDRNLQRRHPSGFTFGQSTDIGMGNTELAVKTRSARCEAPVVRRPSLCGRLPIETSSPEKPPINIRALWSCYEDDNVRIAAQCRACSKPCLSGF